MFSLKDKLAAVAELADARDSKSREVDPSCRFNSDQRHKNAEMAELADAHDSGSCGVTPIGVRLSVSALK